MVWNADNWIYMARRMYASSIYETHEPSDWMSRYRQRRSRSSSIIALHSSGRYLIVQQNDICCKKLKCYVVGGPLQFEKIRVGAWCSFGAWSLRKATMFYYLIAAHNILIWNLLNQLQMAPEILKGTIFYCSHRRVRGLSSGNSWWSDNRNID